MNRFVLPLLFLSGMAGMGHGWAGVGNASEDVTAKELQLHKIQKALEEKRQEAETAEQAAQQLKISLDEIKTDLEKSKKALANTRSEKKAAQRRARERLVQLEKASAEKDMEHNDLAKLWGEYQLSAVSAEPDASERAPLLAMALGVQTGLFQEQVQQVGALEQQAILLHKRTRALSKEEWKRIQEKSEALKTYRKRNVEYTVAENRRLTIQEELANLESTAKELNHLINSLRRREAAEEAKAPSPAPRPVPAAIPMSPGTLPWPTTGRITQKFGKSTQPELGTPVVSNGITIECPVGTPVHAVAPGKIIYAGPFMSYGRIVLIEHLGDWHSIYGQLSEPLPAPDTPVAAGDVIGKTGEDAPFYLEIRLHGKPIDPLPWLQAH